MNETVALLTGEWSRTSSKLVGPLLNLDIKYIHQNLCHWVDLLISYYSYFMSKDTLDKDIDLQFHNYKIELPIHTYIVINFIY